MNRRKLLAFLAGVPFIGILVRPSDGVALYNTAHPSLEHFREPGLLNPDALETVEIELGVYARKGEVVICEATDWHPVGVFHEDLVVGAIPWGHQFRTFQPAFQPTLGDLGPLRCHCGARYTDEKWRFHFLYEGWRDLPEFRGLRINARS